MTTVNTVEDIIEALDANPILLEALRARLLTRELLDLPRVVARLAASQAKTQEDVARLFVAQAETQKEMARLAAVQATMGEEMKRLAIAQAKTQEDVARLFVAQAETQKEMARLAVAQAETQKEMARLAVAQAKTQEDVARLAVAQEKTQVAQEKTQVAQEKTQVAQEKTQEEVARLAASQARMGDDIARLKGERLEMKLQGSIHAILGQRMKLRGTRVVRAAFPSVNIQEFLNAIDSAADDGAITDDQRNRILATDMIAYARRPGSPQPMYLSFEAAHTLDEDDVRRVLETGDALARVFPEAEIMGFIYGLSINERDRARAEANGVEVILERSEF